MSEDATIQSLLSTVRVAVRGMRTVHGLVLEEQDSAVWRVGEVQVRLDDTQGPAVFVDGPAGSCKLTGDNIEVNRVCRTIESAAGLEKPE